MLAVTFTSRIAHICTFIAHHITCTDFHEDLRMLMKVKIGKNKVGERFRERSEIKVMNDQYCSFLRNKFNLPKYQHQKKLFYFLFCLYFE